MDNLNSKIKEYLLVILSNAVSIDDTLIDFCINETIDRIRIYLNVEYVSIDLARVISRVVSNAIKKSIREKDNMDPDFFISSVSDNGQSISYSNEITNYFTTVADNELFNGFEMLLNRYRRIRVVYPKINEK